MRPKSLSKNESQPLKVAEVMRRLMLERGLSVADVTAGTGLTANPVYDLLNNKIKSPRVDTIRRIARFFNISPSFLLYGEEFDLIGSHQPLIAAQIAKEVNAYLRRSREPSYLSEDRKRELLQKYWTCNGPVVFHLPSLKDMSPIQPYQVDRILEALDILDRLSKTDEPKTQPDK